MFADTGYDYLSIIQFYFGDNVFITSSNDIEGIQTPWEQQVLSLGSTGNNVTALQNQLNIISRVYTAIPAPKTDGIFGPATEAAIRAYQAIFNKPVTGVVNAATYFSLTRLYNQLIREERCV